MSLITMSQQELNRLEAIQKIKDRRLSVVQAAELLGLSRSQVHRLLQAYDREGPTGLVSKKRGQPSNRRHSDEFRNIVLDLVREQYHDFGPTLAREKLIELHQISVGKETLRRWMTNAGLWTSRRENGYCESFNARFRDELLDGETFYSLKKAQILTEQWRKHYNTKRTHSAIGNKPPVSLIKDSMASPPP